MTARYLDWGCGAERRTASELRRVIPPRGSRAVTPEMRECWRLRVVEGVPTKELAKKYKISVAQVYHWLDWARDAQSIERESSVNIRSAPNVQRPAKP
jgi:DNA-directed RNA polymerase specialized sigma24 family protein